MKIETAVREYLIEIEVGPIPHELSRGIGPTSISFCVSAKRSP